MKYLLLGMISLQCSLFSTHAMAEEVFRIKLEKNYQDYSNDDLKRRVWELERAVWQLQQKVFELETKSSEKAPTADAWICSISAFGQTYTGTGGSIAVAKFNAIKDCKKGNNGSSFHCSEAKCEH